MHGALAVLDIEGHVLATEDDGISPWHVGMYVSKWFTGAVPEGAKTGLKKSLNPKKNLDQTIRA